MFSSESVMSNRGGLPIKNIVSAVFIIATLYLLYIYNGAQKQLHESEMTGSRYRREAEDRVSEIQELVKGKDELQERCENDKRELTSRVKSINQQLSMLQSQHKETEADFMKLKQDMETMRSDHMQAENQHAQEYQDLKSEKERVIVNLEEEVKQLKAANEEMQNTVGSLRSQIQNEEIPIQYQNNTNETAEVQLKSAVQKVQSLETLQQNLREQNAKLQAQHYQQQQLLNQQQLQQQQAQQQQPQQAGGAAHQLTKADNVVGGGQQPAGFQNGLQQQQQQEQQGNGLVQNMKIPGVNDLSNNGVVMGDAQAQHKDDSGLSNNQVPNAPGADHKVEPPADNNNVNIEGLNAMHQVLPPGNHDNQVEGEEKEGLGENRPEVNPNDLQKGQILEPMLDNMADANRANGGEADVAQGNIQRVENEREKEEMDNTFMEHKKPLALGQMQQPGDLHHFEAEGEGLGQQKPPVMFNEAEKNQEDKNDQQLYYQDDEVNKFLKEDKGNNDFDADEDVEENNDEDDGERGLREQANYADGNDFAHIPQFNAQPNNNINNRFNEEDYNGRLLNADDRDEDYGAAKKFAGEKF